jgi:uncharacterized protein YdeI (BOF family)
MKKYLILIGMSLAVLNAFAQEENSVDSETTKKLTRAQKIEQRRIEAEETAKMVDWMVQNKKFVLEANTVSNQTGERYQVSSRINFIAIDSNKITIQLASMSGIGGYNGMGGITTDGIISQFKITKLGKKSNGYSIQVICMTSIGTYDIFFSVSPNSNADASIGGNWSGKLNYHGFLIPLERSKIFKGMSI